MSSHKDVLDAIKDIDYYKAETQAARNGQDAAMKRAAELVAERDALRFAYASVSSSADSWRITALVLFALWFVTLLLYLLRVIGVL